jgi:DNA-binding NarL/FixJ family response regulator
MRVDTQSLPLLSLLTPAERLVAAHVLQGLSNKEIAATLGKSEATVKNQVASCLKKFGQPSRSRMMAYLHEIT